MAATSVNDADQWKHRFSTKRFGPMHFDLILNAGNVFHVISVDHEISVVISMCFLHVSPCTLSTGEINACWSMSG